MSDHDFFRELESQWQQKDDAPPEFTVEQAMATRRRQKFKTLASILLSLLGLSVAGLFLSQPFSPVVTGAGITLVAVVVFDWVYIWRYRRPITRWEDWSVEGLLHYRMTLIEAEIRNAYYYQFSALGLLGFTAFLWVMALIDPEFRGLGFHTFFSAIAIPIALFVMVFFGVGRKKRLEKRKVLAALMTDFSSEA